MVAARFAHRRARSAVAEGRAQAERASDDAREAAGARRPKPAEDEDADKAAPRDQTVAAASVVRAPDDEGAGLL